MVRQSEGVNGVHGPPIRFSINAFRTLFQYNVDISCHLLNGLRVRERAIEVRSTGIGLFSPSILSVQGDEVYGFGQTVIDLTLSYRY